MELEALVSPATGAGGPRVGLPSLWIHRQHPWVTEPESQLASFGGGKPMLRLWPLDPARDARGNKPCYPEPAQAMTRKDARSHRPTPTRKDQDLCFIRRTGSVAAVTPRERARTLGQDLQEKAPGPEHWMERGRGRSALLGMGRWHQEVWGRRVLSPTASAAEAS